MTRRKPILCPACATVLPPAFIRSSANSLAGSADRPGAKGLVRNPTGKGSDLGILKLRRAAEHLRRGWLPGINPLGDGDAIDILDFIRCDDGDERDRL